jgi:hypothetical protein
MAETEEQRACQEVSEITQYSRLVMIADFFRFNEKFVRGELGIPIAKLWTDRMRYREGE